MKNCSEGKKNKWILSISDLKDEHLIAYMGNDRIREENMELPVITGRLLLFQGLGVRGSRMRGKKNQKKESEEKE